MGTVTATVTDASGLTASSSVAYTVSGGTGPQATVYTAEPLGAGGWVTGITISPDGLTRLVRTDTMGAWRWDTTTDSWVACITGTSMPSPDNQLDSGQGVQAIVATNTVAWMGYKSGVYKSTDRGASWTLSLNGPTTSPNTGSQRWWNTRMAVSRTDPSVCLYGTLAGGVYYTTTGGASWTQVPATTVPFGASGFGVPCVAIDPAGNFYVAPTGAGVYRSTDRGATWAKVSLDTQFLTVAGMDCGPNGDVMVTAHTSATVFDETTAVVYRYRTGTWTQLTLGGSVRTWRSPAYDPLTPGQVHIKGDGGYERRSTDYGTTWTIPLHTFVSTAPDVPWLAVANGGAADFFFTTVGGLQFDPVVPNRLWKSQGIGVWYCDLPASLTARMTWNAQSRGIEQLVVNDVFAPPGGSPLVVCWDRAIFLVGETS